MFIGVCACVKAYMYFATVTNCFCNIFLSENCVSEIVFSSIKVSFFQCSTLRNVTEEKGLIQRINYSRYKFGRSGFVFIWAEL